MSSSARAGLQPCPRHYHAHSLPATPAQLLSPGLLVLLARAGPGGDGLGVEQRQGQGQDEEEEVHVGRVHLRRRSNRRPAGLAHHLVGLGQEAQVGHDAPCL